MGFLRCVHDVEVVLSSVLGVVADLILTVSHFLCFTSDLSI